MKKKITFTTMLFISIYFLNAQTVIWSNDFESYADNTTGGTVGFTIWEGSGQVSDITIDLGTSNTGNKFFNGLRSNTQNKSLYIRKAITLTVGNSYIYEAWVKSPNSLSISNGVKLGSSSDVGGQSTSNTTWTKLSKSFTVGVGQSTVEVFVNMYSWSGATRLHLDDMRVIQAYNIAASSNNITYGGVSGSGIIAESASVSLTATPETGYHFVNWTLDTSGGAIQSTSQTYTFTASADKTLVANFEPNTVPISSGVTNATDITCTTCDVTVATGAELTIGADKTLKSVTVAAGGKLTISTGALTATNGVTLQSTSAGTATFVDTNNDAPQAVSGTVEQYLSSARNWYLSSPIVNATVPTGQTYYSYNEAGSNTGFVSPATAYWVAVPAETVITNPMKGYITQPGASTTKTYSGTFNTGTKSITLTRTNSAAKPGFNLVANPYPSYLDWQLVDTTTTANIHSSVWYRTKTTGGAYTFDTYNGGLEVATSNGENTVSKLIPPMQAFWVRVKSGYTSGTLTFTNSMRKHVDVVGNKFKAPALTETKLVRLRVTNGINNDETLLCFNAKASTGFDNYDSPKMFNDNTVIPEIFTKAGTENLVINGMNEIPYDTEIPLGFVTGQTDDFSISRTEMTNFATGTRILLKDKLYPTTEFELAEGLSYNFSSQPTTATTDRFSLVFRAPGVTTGIDNATKLNAQVFVNAANQIVIIAPVKSNYAIYNAMGQLIENGALNTERETLNAKLNAGMYVVKVGNVSTRVVVK